MSLHTSSYKIKKDDPINVFLDNCKKRNRSDKTIQSYAQDLKKFKNWLNIARRKKSLSKVTSEDINLYQSLLTDGGKVYRSAPWPLHYFIRPKYQFEQKPLSVNTRKRKLSTIKNFYDFYQQYYKVKSNPVKMKLHSIKLKDIDMTHTPMIYEHEWQILYESKWRVSDRLIMALMYFGGLRLSEVANLHIDSLDLNNKTINFYRKGGGYHRLKIHEFELINSLWAAQVNKNFKSSLFLFPGRFGKQISSRSLYQRIKNSIFDCKINQKISPHSLRKACATNLYQRTKDLLYVRDYLFHADAKVTQTYIDKNILDYSYNNYTIETTSLIANNKLDYDRNYVTQ